MARMVMTTMSSARVNQESFFEAALRSARKTLEETESETWRRERSEFRTETEFKRLYVNGNKDTENLR